MAQNFIGCDREQAFLMPPSLREWLPEDHLAWFVIEAVEEMEAAEFYADYREDGHGRAAYEPSMMVALVLYAYATKQRSSRAIERHCRQDIGYRVISANRVPDHATIARFLARHEAALAGLFGSVLARCARAGLVSTGVVAIDGTKLYANASREANLDYERIAREILAEARATDEAEDELYGEAGGDELPEELRTSAGRRKWLREAKQAPDQESTTDPAPPAEEPASMPRGRAKDQGRRGWRRDARRACEGGRPSVARGRRRRRRLLAPRADRQPRRERDRGADSARRRQAKGRPARLAGRSLRVDAQGARDRARRAALPTTLTDGRAGVWSHQAQPRHEQASPTRQVRSAHRMAPDRPPLTTSESSTVTPRWPPRRESAPKRPRLHRNRPARPPFAPADRFPRQPPSVASVGTIPEETTASTRERKSARIVDLGHGESAPTQLPEVTRTAGALGRHLRRSRGPSAAQLVGVVMQRDDDRFPGGDPDR
jgi:transposase